MDRLRVAVLALVATLLAACSATVPEPAPAEAFRVASFNIAYIRDPDGLPKWERRREAVAAVVAEIDADILAFQEMETFAGGSFNPVNRQLDWVLANAPHYRAGAVGEASRFPSTQPILYRAERFELLDQGWFSFSPTPDRPFARGFDGGPSSFASTVRLRDRRDGRAFTVVNVHPDARDADNRLRAAELIAARARPLVASGEPVLVVGDLNASRGSPTVMRVKEAGFEGTDLLRPTYHLGVGLGFAPAVDHILHSPAFERVGEAVRHRGRYAGAFPSDHYPVSALYRLVR